MFFKKMLKFYILVLLIVYQSLAYSDFIRDYKRADIFELTDDNVITFKVNILDEDFAEIKKQALDPPIDINGFDSSEDFKTKNATLEVSVNGTVKTFDKLNFSLGGSSSRYFAKQGYNIKLRGNQDLFGRSHFRLRPDSREATYLRSKLACDIHNRLGIPSISANYATLYINGEYMGLYVLMDAIKKSWIKYVYGEDDPQYLYQCKSMNNLLTVNTSGHSCTNLNELITNHSEWFKFLVQLDNAESAEDIEDIFDIDLFLKEMVFEYLSGSWDHYINYGHNFYLYKPVNGGKWQYLMYDFDAEFGQDIDNAYSKTLSKTKQTNFPEYDFIEMSRKRHLLDILILRDSTRFDNILRDIVTETFNPTVLFPHIDKLKEFIRPYVELDKKKGENGEYPGRINYSTGKEYTFEQWEANCEFTEVNTTSSFKAYGLKEWILKKYNYVCKKYNINCDPNYENYSYEVDSRVKELYPISNKKENETTTQQSVTTQQSMTTTTQQSMTVQQSTTAQQPVSKVHYKTYKALPSTTQKKNEATLITFLGNSKTSETTDSKTSETAELKTTKFLPTLTTTTTTTTVDTVENNLLTSTTTSTTKVLPTTYIKTSTTVDTVENNLLTPTPTTTKIIKAQTTPTETATFTTISIPEINTSKYSCWGEFLGYKCCGSSNYTFYKIDKNGSWGKIDGEKCGISPYVEIVEDEECWSEKLGYPCCKGCQDSYTDSDGSWGLENNNWCGIQSYCSNLKIPTSAALTSKPRCWAEYLGYKCCGNNIKMVTLMNQNGIWGTDPETGEYCGISRFVSVVPDDECWSEKSGYPCCRGCQVEYTDSKGNQWGKEHNDWCGIQSYCNDVKI